jgi:hypothetical protein
MDPRRRAALPERSLQFTPGDLQAVQSAQRRREAFQGRPQTAPKPETRVKFQFDHRELLDLIVLATFGIAEPTCRIFEFLSDFVFAEGTLFICSLAGGKQFQSTKNQRLQDVRVIGDSLVAVRLKKFTGLKDAVRAQFEERLAGLRAAEASA